MSSSGVVMLQGSDYYFSEGVAEVDPSRLEVLTPYTGHHKNLLLTENVISLEDVDLAKEPKVIYETRKNKKTRGLVDPYLDGNKAGYVKKVAYIFPGYDQGDRLQKFRQPSYAIFYDDLDSPGGPYEALLQICMITESHSSISESGLIGYLNYFMIFLMATMS